MPTASQRKQNRMLGFLLGVFLCALLCAFAVAAKTALYDTHPHRMQALTATKVWKGTGTAADVADHVSEVPATLAIVAVVFGLTVLPAVQPFAFAQPRRRFAPWPYASLALAVRPPPAA